MEIVRTPDARFADLPGYDFAPSYVWVDSGDGDDLRMHYVDEGQGPTVLMLHGEPSWAYLYRKMIPVLVDAGFRVVVPDLVGFGRSDKPVEREAYTYTSHTGWVAGLLDALDLDDLHLVCQDWGGLIGLRLVGQQPDRFAAVVAANTWLPTGEEKMPEAFFMWREASQTVPEFDAGQVIRLGTVTDPGEAILDAYRAPFPDQRYCAGARQFPAIVPVEADDPEAVTNREAWEVLERWDKPFLTAFGDGDPITRGADKRLQARVPGAKDQPHTIIEGAGHFIQEDQGEALAEVAAAFFQGASGR